MLQQGGGCWRKELASPLPGTWPQVGKVWVLLLQLRKKHFAHTHKQVLSEQGQKPGPALSPATLQVPSLQHRLEEPALGLGQRVLGQAGARAVKCQDSGCWAVLAESVLVPGQWHQCQDDWCWDSCHQACLNSTGTGTAVPSSSPSEG